MHHNKIMTRNQSREKQVARWLERLDAKRVSSIYMNLLKYSEIGNT